MSAIEERIVANGHGRLSPSYFAVHSTANPGATAENHASYWRNNPDYAVHLVSDWSTCLHTVPYDRLCWHVGNGNGYCEGIELCEATTRGQFDAGIEVAARAVAERLRARGWGTDRLITHHQAAQKWGGSDHTDPDPYFAKWGYTWEKFVIRVQGFMEGEDVITEEDCKRIADQVMRYTLPDDDGSSDDVGNFLREIRRNTRTSADSNWRYTLPCDDGSDDDAGNYMREIRGGVRDLKVTVEAQYEAIKALASAQGADPDEVAKAVSDAVAKKLESIDLTVTVGD